MVFAHNDTSGEVNTSASNSNNNNHTSENNNHTSENKESRDSPIDSKETNASGAPHSRSRGHDVYQGEMVNDLRHGQGRFTFRNGDVYTGHWRDHKKDGRCVADSVPACCESVCLL